MTSIFYGWPKINLDSDMHACVYSGLWSPVKMILEQ